MFSRFNNSANSMPSFILLDKKTNKPKAIFVGTDAASDPKIMKLLKQRQREGKLKVADNKFSFIKDY